MPNISASKININSTVLWDITLSYLLNVNQNFRGTYCLQLITFLQAGILLGLFSLVDGGDMFIWMSAYFQRTSYSAAYTVKAAMRDQNSKNLEYYAKPCYN
jgi:hypothetical protein